jgi:hypothetical protein
MPLETCWAFNERWNNKFCYKVASCWLFLLSITFIVTGHQIFLTFLGAFVRLGNSTVSFVMSLSVHPFFRMARFSLERLSRNLVFEFFKSVAKILVSLKWEQNGYFTWRPIHIFNYMWLSSFKIKNVSKKSGRENQNTHFMFNNFFSENCAVYEIISKNILEWAQATDDNITRAHCMLDT